MQPQLMQAQKEYSEFLLFCQEVSKMFEVGKCYQMLGHLYDEVPGTQTTVNLGRFSNWTIDVRNMSVVIGFETLISIDLNFTNQTNFTIVDEDYLWVNFCKSIDFYKIVEVSEEHFLNMQSRVIALQVTKRQLIKEFTQKQKKIDNSIFTAV